ncbi:MAG: hypothetical protein GY842_00900 [bacterium]|nr:hypothetical protein [bacterium]
MKLDLNGLIQLIASGNSKTVEESWMSAVDVHGGDADEVASWSPALKELGARNRMVEAEPLAWAAIEAVKESVGVEAAAKVAGAYLLALPQSVDLRAQTAELYAAAYADRENLSGLLDEAGLASGRPPRRALRTMDVCLALQPGGYLVGRHDEDEAARVEAVDTQTWEVTITTAEGQRTLDPVRLADEYAPAAEDDFPVLQQFDPERLAGMLAKKPAEIVISIMRANGGRIDSIALAERLSPKPIAHDDWSKWWTKARTALRRHLNVQITGRSPYELAYVTEAVTLEGDTEAKFKKLYDSLEQLSCIEAYLRECKSAGNTPDAEMLTRFKTRVDQAVKRHLKNQLPGSLQVLLVARTLAVALGVPIEDADRPSVEFLSRSAEPADLLFHLGSVALWPVAWASMKAAYPEKYLDFGEAMLPQAPPAVCDLLATDLLAGGLDRGRLEALVQRILKDPGGCVTGLAWLWRGPDPKLGIPVPPLRVLYGKLQAVAGEMRRRDDLPRERKKMVQDRVREAFSADQYKRFKECLAQTDGGVAKTWRIQLSRMDNLGRAVPEDMIKLIQAAHPEQHRQVEVSPWMREDILFMTADGRRRLGSEIEQMVNVKMRENAKAIGDAAAHGDLSENSEYKFALEERDLLRARLALWQEQAGLAVVMDAEEVPTDQVGFGTRVTLRSSGNGNTVQMSFLGPWEADVDRAVYNYKSPVGQALMGAALGGTVELTMTEHPGTYIVERLENVLAVDADAAVQDQNLS